MSKINPIDPKFDQVYQQLQDVMNYLETLEKTSEPDINLALYLHQNFPDSFPNPFDQLESPLISLKGRRR